MKKKLRRAVNAELIRAMEVAHVSRAELARRLKVSRPTVTQLLAPARNLQLDTLEEMARVMGYQVTVCLRRIA